MVSEFKSKAMLAWLVVSLLSIDLPAQSASTLEGAATKNTHPKSSSTYHARAQNTYRKPKSFWAKHPMVKNATIGAGVGAAAGGVTGLVTHGGFMRGALMGAGAGAGVGAIRTSKTLQRHPYMRDGATGAVTGLGLGLAASRSRGVALGGAGLGGAAGLGYRYLKNR